MGNYLKGDELMLFKGTPAVALAYAQNHTFNISGSEVDVSTKDHGFWGSTTIGNLSWEATTQNLYVEDNYDELYDAMVSKTPIDIVFAKASNYDENGLASEGGTVQSWTQGTGYKGKAVITSLEVNANTGENATYSATFKGAGALSKVTVS